MLKGRYPISAEVLWPEFQELDQVLVDYLAEITDRIIREEVFGDKTEAKKVEPRPGIAR